MQPRVFVIFSLALAMYSLPAYAGNYSAVEVGTTGEQLRNTAVHQNKHYLKDDHALSQRIAAVLIDMDNLLGKLHALPPELADSAMITDAATDELGLLVGLALAENPELQPFRSTEAVLAARTRQAGAMHDPTLSVMFMGFPFPQLPLDDTMMTRLDVGISQKFESHGKRKLKRTIASLEEELTEHSLAQRELDLAGQVAALYIDMLSTRANQRILDQNIELVRLLLELAETKYAVGMVPQGQVLSAQVELTKLQERSINLENLFDKQRQMLLGLLGNPDESVLDGLLFSTRYPQAASLDVDQGYLLAAALDSRPDYQRLALMEEQQELMLELARRGYKPDYTISANYGIRWGRRDFISAGIMFPVFTHKEERQDAKVQETYAMLDVTASKREALANMLETRIAVLAVEANRLKDSIDIYSNALVPQARLALDANIDGFAANKIDLSELFMAQRMLLSYEQDLEQKYIEYIGALAELQTITAGEFDPRDYVLPGGDSALAGSHSGIELPEAEPFATVPAEQFIPPTKDGFIGGLALPEHPAAAGEPGESSAEPAPESASPADEAAQDEPAEDLPDNGGFYEPFTPRSKER
jgi:outer membrane protein TolC